MPCTRITQTSATLIDNIYVKCKQLGNNIVSCILTADISDHFPVLLFLKNKIAKTNLKSSFSFLVKLIMNRLILLSAYCMLLIGLPRTPSNKINEYINLCAPLKRTLSPYFRNSPLLHITIRLHLTSRLLKFMQWLARKQYVLCSR